LPTRDAAITPGRERRAVWILTPEPVAAELAVVELAVAEPVAVGPVDGGPALSG
jgi:hypothetical protein